MLALGYTEKYSLDIFLAPLFGYFEVVDVPFTLRARCELFVLSARLVGMPLPLLDFVAAVLSAAAVVAAAAAAAGVRMSDEMA